MKIIKIKKGKHRPMLPELGLYFNNKYIERVYTFDESCIYDRGDDDQYDINKLFGIGFFPHHHKNSARIGYRWSTEKRCFEIFSYLYVKSVRKVEFICDVNVNEEFRVKIIPEKKLRIIVDTSLGLYIKNYEIMVPKITYRLGVYIGGGDSSGKDDAAMHDTYISYKKL